MRARLFGAQGMKSDRLVYLSTNYERFMPSLSEGEERFDVAINDFREAPATAGFTCALQLSRPGLKFKGIRENMEALLAKPYAYYAFLDDDLEISGKEINCLFELGHLLKLDLWQPAHATSSHNVHHVLWSVEGSFVRRSDFVEVMCPFFSRRALEAVSPYFYLSESGWGLDYLWPKILHAHNIAVVDAVLVNHTKPSSSYAHRSSTGLSPGDELQAVNDFMTTLPDSGH
jgi:hypothetical protein